MFNSVVLKRAKFFTWTVAILAIISTLTINFFPKTLYYFWFYPPLINQGEFWRLFSPCFIHFEFMGNGIVHILFNLLIWFYFASAIEFLEKNWKLPLIFLISSLSSNIAAFWAYGYNFGGLSGVNFALLGYVGVFILLDKPPYNYLASKSLIIFFIIYMLIGFTGIFGNVANMAHLAGFVSGAVLGFLSSFRNRKNF